MAADPTPEYDRRKIRGGLALISAVFAIAVVLLLVVDSAIGRAIMFAVALTALVRAFLLSRALRRGR